MRRLGPCALVAAAIAAVTLVLAAAPALAHALPQSSDPAAGATLTRAPTTVKVTFGETPDPKLSQLRVLDSGGQDHTNSKTTAVAGDPRTLQVTVGPVPEGVYTVSLRTVSQVDGHLAAGTFAFGVGVAPAGAGTARFTNNAATPSTTSVVARWLLYAGLMVLVGGAFLGVVCYRAVPSRLPGVLIVAVVLAAVGAAGITFDARRADRLAWSKLSGSSLGHQLGGRAIPILAAAVLDGIALGRSGSRRQRALIAVAGVAGLAGMWGEVQASHAAAGHTLRLLRMADQWAHFAAAGIWVRGLVAHITGTTDNGTTITDTFTIPVK